MLSAAKNFVLSELDVHEAFYPEVLPEVYLRLKIKMSCILPLVPWLVFSTLCVAQQAPASATPPSGTSPAPPASAEPGNFKPAADLGEVTINTQPAGLAVSIDDESVGASPVRTNLSAGAHTFSVTCSGTVFIKRSFSLDAGHIRTYILTCPQPLARSSGSATDGGAPKGNFNVETIPPRLKVLVDGKPVGSSPVRGTLRAGKHQCTIKCRGRDVQRDFVIQSGVITSYVLACYNKDLSPAEEWGDMVVETQPPGLRVLIDGQSRGPTPAAITLNAGQHSYTVDCPGAGHFVESFDLAAGKTRTFLVTCKQE